MTNTPINIDPSSEYKLSAKREDTGRFWSFGKMSVNQFGNWSIGIKVTPELKALVNAKDGGYINLSVFEDERKQTHHSAAKANAYAPDELDQEVPF